MYYINCGTQVCDQEEQAACGEMHDSCRWQLVIGLTVSLIKQSPGFDTGPRISLFVLYSTSAFPCRTCRH